MGKEFYFIPETGAHYVALAGLELTEIHRFLPSKGHTIMPVLMLKFEILAYRVSNSDEGSQLHHESLEQKGLSFLYPERNTRFVLPASSHILHFP